MDKLFLAAVRYVGIGASIAFGWIFGENAATKIVDKMDAHSDKKKSKKKDEKTS